MPDQQTTSVFQRLAKTFGQIAGISTHSSACDASVNTITFSRKPPEPSLLERLKRTETGQDLVVRAKEANLLLAISSAKHMQGAKSRSHFHHIVEINEELSVDQQILALAAELARVLLARQNLAPSHRHTSLARIQIGRVVSAHMLATCAQIADELARIGDCGPRDCFIVDHPDIMAAYQSSCDSHPDAASNGAAMANAFMAFYHNRDLLAHEEQREISYLERLPASILEDIRNFCQPYHDQQNHEKNLKQAILSVIAHPLAFRKNKKTIAELADSSSHLPAGHSDLLKLVNAKGVPYVSTFFPQFTPTDTHHGSVMPESAARIRNLDAKRSPLSRQFRKASTIPVHLSEQKTTAFTSASLAS